MYGIAAGARGKWEAYIPGFKRDDSVVHMSSWLQNQILFSIKRDFDYIEALGLRATSIAWKRIPAGPFRSVDHQGELQ